MLKINTIFTPLTTATKPPLGEEVNLWEIQRRVLRRRTFNYLSSDDYSNMGLVRYQNIGLLSLCSVLREQGHEVSYTTSDNVELLDIDRLADADLILITSYTSNFNQAVTIAKKIKKKNSNILIGIGGYHAPFVAKDLLKSPNYYFDFTIKGYSENSILLLAKIIKSNGSDKNLEKIPGIIFRRKNGEVIFNEKYSPPDLKEIPLPANDLIPLGKIVSARIFSAYGCPFSCQMCNLGAESSYSERGLKKIKKEIIFLKNKGLKYVYFGDPTFGANLKRTEGLVHMMNKSFPDLPWGCQSRINIINNQDMINLLRDSNCIHIEIGVESFSRGLLDRMNKRVDSSATENALYRLLENTNLYIETNWMFGIPGSTEDLLQQDVDKMHQFVKDGMDIHISVFCPFPGTAVYTNPVSFGIVMDDPILEHFTMYGAPVFTNLGGMPKEKVLALYKKSLRDLKDTFLKYRFDEISTEPVKDIGTEVSYF